MSHDVTVCTALWCKCANEHLCICLAGMCTILDVSGGTLAGMACGIQKRFGFPSRSVLGGQQVYLRVMPTP